MTGHGGASRRDLGDEPSGVRNWNLRGPDHGPYRIRLNRRWVLVTTDGNGHIIGMTSDGTKVYLYGRGDGIFVGYRDTLSPGRERRPKT